MRGLILFILVAVLLVACGEPEKCEREELREMWAELNAAFALSEYEEYGPIMEAAAETENQLAKCEQTATVKLFQKVLDGIDGTFVPAGEGEYTLNIGRLNQVQEDMETLNSVLYD